jgi:hypothetical protein
VQVWNSCKFQRSCRADAGADADRVARRLRRWRYASSCNSIARGGPASPLTIAVRQHQPVQPGARRAGADRDAALRAGDGRLAWQLEKAADYRRAATALPQITRGAGADRSHRYSLRKRPRAPSRS